MNRKRKAILIAAALLVIVLLIPITSAEDATLALLTRKFESAVQRGTVQYANLYNVEGVAKADLKEVGQLARTTGGKVFFNFNTLVDNKVTGRVTVNPNLVTDTTGRYSFALDISEEAVKNVKAVAENAFMKNAWVIKCNEDSFGMTVLVSAKLNIGKNADELRAYSYSDASGQFTELDKGVSMVDDGYAYVETKLGGYIVIVEK